MKLVQYVVVLCLLWLSETSYGQTDYIVVSPGSTVHLSAQPDDLPTYMWFHDGIVIPGATTHVYAASLPGYYAVLAINAGGCPSDRSDEFRIMYTVPPPSGIGNQVFCIHAYATVADLEAAGENIQWYTAAVGGTPLASTNLLVAGIYYASQTIDGVESSERFPIIVTLVDCADLLFITKTVNEQYPMVGSQVVFSISVHNNSSLTLSNIVVEEQVPSGYFYVSSEASAGTYHVNNGQWIIPELLPLQEATLEIRVMVLAQGEYRNRVCILSSIPDDPDDDDCAEVETFPNCLQVYNEFSPNGDGKNELFKIDCIENYPKNTLRVYNRWGKLVYEKSPYDNTWDGTALRDTGTIQRGEKLPQGTYFYSLDMGNGSKPMVSWLYIVLE